MADAMLVHHFQCTNGGQILQAYNKSMLNIVFLFLCFFFVFVQTFQVLNEVQYHLLRMHTESDARRAAPEPKEKSCFIPFKQQI